MTAGSVLVMSQAGGPNEDAGRWAASRLPAGEFVSIDRPDLIPVVGDPAPLLDELRRFVVQTVKDLVAGSGIAFSDRGTHELKGIPGEWRLYAVNSS